MRIAHVTSGLDHNAAGVGAMVEALSAAQRAEGYEVKVFGLKSPDWTNSWNGAPAEAFQVHGWPSSFGYAPGLVRALIRFDPDIVHVHGLWMYPALAVRRWHKIARRPYVYSPHGMLSPIALSFSSRKKMIARILFQNDALTHASILHATAEAEAEDIRLFGLTNQIALVPLGIHFTVPPQVRPGPNKKVLTLGRMHPVKNLELLIEAWAHLEDRFPSWVLEIVGPDEGGHKANLEALATRLKVRRLSFGSPIFGVERDASMASADLFVLPSKSENFALTVAESLMMETPVIATHGAPWPGLVREGCGWWIEAGLDPMIGALNSAMSLPDDTRRAMGQRGRAWMLRDHTWSKVAQKFIAVYEEATSAFG